MATSVGVIRHTTGVRSSAAGAASTGEAVTKPYHPVTSSDHRASAGSQVVFNAHMSLVLHDPATYAHGFPYDEFRALRDEEPVSHHDHPGWERGYWAVTRHADVQRVSRDWTAFRNAPQSVPARHRRLRRRRHVTAADQPRPARAHEAAQDHQQRLHASSHQRPRRAREGTGRLRDRFGRRSAASATS